MKSIIFSFLILSLVVISGCNSGPGEYDAFAQCLTENGAVMYGTDWCSHCKDQKAEFGKSFGYVRFVNCDLQKGECIENGVTGYPTWVIEGENYPGKQSLSRLGDLAGCELA